MSATRMNKGYPEDTYGTPPFGPESSEGSGRGSRLLRAVIDAAGIVDGARTAPGILNKGAESVWESLPGDARRIIKAAGEGALAGALAESSLPGDKPVTAVGVLGAAVRGGLEGARDAAVDAGHLTPEGAERITAAAANVAELVMPALVSRFPGKPV